MPSDSQPATESQIKWISEFTGVTVVAQAQEEREAKQKRAIASSLMPLQEEGALEGLDFTMKIRVDANLKSRFLAKFGVQQEMRSLTGTGDAMKEIDTHHDLGSLESISGEDMAKAMKSMEKVAEAGKELDARLMPVFLEEQGINPSTISTKQLEMLEEQYQEKLNRRLYPLPKGEQIEADKKKKQEWEERTSGWTEEEKAAFEELQGKYDKAKGKVGDVVREEVYAPLVRSGTMPENLVPDRYSEVARTFEGASEAYNERLKEYTKNAGEHDELLHNLGVASTLITHTASMVTGVLKMVPGSEAVEIATKTIEVCSIVQAGAFNVTKQIIEQKDAGSIAQAVANTIGAAISKAGVPPAIATFITGGLNLAVTGVRTVQAIAAGDTKGIFAAVADGIVQSLAMADAANGTNNAKTIGPMVAGTIRTLGAAGNLAVLLNAKPPNPKLIEEAMSALVEEGIKAVTTNISSVVGVTTGNKDAVKGIEIAGKGLAGIATSLLSEDKIGGMATALGTAADECCVAYLPETYGKAVGSGLKTAFTTGGGLAKAFKSRDPGEAVTAIEGLISGGLDASLKATGVKGNQAAVDAITATRTAVDGIIKSSMLIRALQGGSLSDIESALNDIFEMVASQLATRLTGVEDDEEEDEDDSGTEEDEDEADDSGEGEEEPDPAAEQGESIARDNEALSRSKLELAEAVLVDPEATDEQKQAAQLQKELAEAELKEQEDLKEAFQKESVDFTRMLSASFPSEEPDPNEDIPTLKQMIAKLERDKKIFEMVNSFVDMGLSMAANFFPPMAAAFDFKKFTVEIGLAVAHAKALLEWKKNVKDARNAVSVQAHAMLSRVKLEEDAVIEHNIRAAIALTSAIGNVLVTVGGQAAPVGAGLVAGAKVAEAGLEVALTIKSEVEMRTAWNGYLKALKNPKDRKTVRMAIQNNPTLAKYAMAWGALKDNNPIAKEALRKCGITDAVLAKENEGIKDIVAYMETLYADDPVVLRSMPDTKEWGWDPPDPELTVRGWAKFLAAAQSRKGQMKAGTGGAIGAALQAAESARAELQAATIAYNKARAFSQKKAMRKMIDGTGAPKEGEKKDPAAVQLAVKLEVTETRTGNCVTVLGTLRLEFRKFQPVDTRDQPYPRIREYLDALDALAELDQRKVEKDLAKLKEAA